MPTVPKQTQASAPEVERRELENATERFAWAYAAQIAESPALDRAVGLVTEPCTAASVFRPAPELTIDNGPPPERHVYAKHRETRERIERSNHGLTRMMFASEPRPRPTIGNFTIDDLAEDTCKFPHGDEAPFTFCGARATVGSYCGEHAFVCFNYRGAAPVATAR